MLPVPDRESCSFSSFGRAVDGLHAGEIASRHKRMELVPQKFHSEFQMLETQGPATQSIQLTPGGTTVVWRPFGRIPVQHLAGIDGDSDMSLLG